MDLARLFNNMGSPPFVEDTLTILRHALYVMFILNDREARTQSPSTSIETVAFDTVEHNIKRDSRLQTQFLSTRTSNVLVVCILCFEWISQCIPQVLHISVYLNYSVTRVLL